MIYPSRISQGDKVAIVAPAGRIGKNDLNMVLKVLEAWGLYVSLGSHVFEEQGYFSSTEERRIEDLQDVLDDRKVKAVFCARGGYGTGKILDKLDFRKFLNSPKWIIGFSDITLLHLKLHKIGVASLHAPVARQIGKNVDQTSIELLRQILFGENRLVDYHLPFMDQNIEGKVSGRILGGNLTLICNNMGTSSDVDFRDKILFIEETSEKHYAIDRHLNQLERTGRLKDLRGLIAGQFTDMKDSDQSFGKSVCEIISGYSLKYRIPTCFGLESGHGQQNLPIPLSFRCNLDIDTSGTSIQFYP